MHPTLLEKKEVGVKRLNLRQEMFCKFYATDPTVMGIGTEAYRKAYGEKSIEVLRVLSAKLMAQSTIVARINYYLSLDGFNDASVDTQHNFIIHQKKDLGVAMKGIEHYNRLKKRVDNKMELIIPRPVMELDADETIRKVDKSKARDVKSEPEIENQVELE